MFIVANENTHNKTYQSAIKMKPIDVKSKIYIDFDKENKEKKS